MARNNTQVPADLQELPTHNVRALSGGDDITLISDDAALVVQVEKAGVPARLWTAELTVPDGACIMLALCHQLVSRAVRKQFSNARVLVLPIYSFDDSFDAIVYTIRLVFHTDFADSCRRNNAWIDVLRNKPDGVLHFIGSGTDLRAQLHDNLRVNTSLEAAVNSGEWVSVADYCEVSVTAPSQTDWLGAFTINGCAEAVGVLVAEDSRVTQSGKERILRAKQLQRQFADSGSVQIVVEDGVLRSAIVAGRERAPEIADVTNPEYSLHTLELGLGSNPSVAPLVDWTVNSQLNEGVGVVHLGFGEGITGAHMDFVVCGAGVI